MTADTLPLVQITLGQVTTILSGFLAFASIVAGAFKLGSLNQRVETNEGLVVRRLSEFGDRFGSVERFMDDVRVLTQSHETRITVLERLPRFPRRDDYPQP